MENLNIIGAGLLVKLNDDKVYQVSANTEQMKEILLAARDIIGKDNLPIDNLPYEDLDLKTFKEIENGKTENF